MGLLSSKVRLFRVAGIDVQLHSLFLVFAAVEIWRGFDEGHPGWTVVWLGALWLSVLLHEFGHCWGARTVGGEAHEVILWPLGGLALVEAPMTPWAQFVMTACGPLVNVILAALGVLVGWLAFHLDPVNLILGREWDAMVIGTFVNVNVMLFAFNMIPAFPMDAGRLLQVGLWTRIGFQRATRIAIYTSFVCSGALIVAGILKSQNAHGNRGGLRLHRGLQYAPDAAGGLLRRARRAVAPDLPDPRASSQAAGADREVARSTP